MFSWEEIKRSVGGSMEIALFMPGGCDKFGETSGEALRSFLVPILFFPLTIILFYVSPDPKLTTDSLLTVAALYGLRMLIAWIISLGAIYLVVSEINRKQYFFKFVTASNWLAVPSTTIVLPVLFMMYTGSRSGDELFIIAGILMLYSYAFTAFMATYVLRIPWELAGALIIASMIVNDRAMDIVYWINSAI
jgi:hypothetical protein